MVRAPGARAHRRPRQRTGARSLGAPGRRLGSRAGTHFSPAAVGCGRTGRLVLNGRSASPPLALQRRAAGLGGAATKEQGGASFAGGLELAVHHRVVAPSLSSCFFSPPLTLEDNLALILSPLYSLSASTPDILDLSVSLSDATPLEEIRGLWWACCLSKEENLQHFHPLYSRASSTPVTILWPN